MVNPSRGMVMSQSADHVNVKVSKVSQVLVLAPVVGLPVTGLAVWNARLWSIVAPAQNVPAAVL